MMRQLWGKLGLCNPLSQMKWEQTFRFTESPQGQLAARRQEVTVEVNPEIYSRQRKGVGTFGQILNYWGHRNFQETTLFPICLLLSSLPHEEKSVSWPSLHVIYTQLGLSIPLRIGMAPKSPLLLEHSP